MPRHKTAKPVVVKIDISGFTASETFRSKEDADAWKLMVDTTPENIEKVDFDLNVYASGLAATVRSCGGPYTMQKWLHPEVPASEWKKGLPCPVDHQQMLQGVLSGRPLKPKHEYIKKGD
jgi:hypothetical protein